MSKRSIFEESESQTLMSTDQESKPQNKFAYKFNLLCRDPTRPEYEEPTEAEIQAYVFKILGVDREKRREPQKYET